MKHLKSFLSFTAPLVIMLITFSVYLIVNKVVDNYKKNITNDYSIIVISNTPMVKIDKVANIRVKDIEILSREKIIDGIKSNISDTTEDLLKNKLPYFYKIYLMEFPTTLKLEQIKKELSQISNVKKVETFSSDHNKVYSLLILIQDIVVILFTVVLILSSLLIIKQVQIWFFEHTQRIYIIRLHGGSLFYSSKPILKMMVLSSVFSSLFVVLSVSFLFNNISILVQPEILGLIPSTVGLGFELFKVILLSFAIPLITFAGLLIKYKMR